jgi:hypothetical protein
MPVCCGNTEELTFVRTGPFKAAGDLSPSVICSWMEKTMSGKPARIARKISLRPSIPEPCPGSGTCSTTDFATQVRASRQNNPWSASRRRECREGPSRSRFAAALGVQGRHSSAIGGRRAKAPAESGGRNRNTPPNGPTVDFGRIKSLGSEPGRYSSHSELNREERIGRASHPQSSLSFSHCLAGWERPDFGRNRSRRRVGRGSRVV